MFPHAHEVSPIDFLVSCCVCKYWLWSMCLFVYIVISLPGSGIFAGVLYRNMGILFIMLKIFSDLRNVAIH
jgi:hypothetical protein